MKTQFLRITTWNGIVELLNVNKILRFEVIWDSSVNEDTYTVWQEDGHYFRINQYNFNLVAKHIEILA